MPLEGRDFRLELGNGVKMVIVGVELVEVVDVKVIGGSGVVIMLSISERSDLVAKISPVKLKKMSKKSIFSTSGLQTFLHRVILLHELLPVAFLGTAHSPPLQFSSVSS